MAQLLAEAVVFRHVFEIVIGPVFDDVSVLDAYDTCHHMMRIEHGDRILYIVLEHLLLRRDHMMHQRLKDDLLGAVVAVAVVVVTWR